MYKMKLKFAILFTTLFLVNGPAVAAETTKNNTQTDTPTVSSSEENDAKQRYQSIVDDYKKYLQTVPKNIRDEIKDYRKEIIRLNNEKRTLYKKLTTQAQEFLKKERDYKKKLPIRMRRHINDNAK